MIFSILLYFVLSFLTFLNPARATPEVHCPRAVDPPPVPDNFMDLEGWQTAEYVLRSILRDEPLNVDQPELGATYAFFVFPESRFYYENWCNGGKHVYLVIASWQKNRPITSNDFVAFQYDLVVNNVDYDKPCNPDREKTMTLVGNDRETCYKMAEEKWLETKKDGRKWLFQGLGKVGHDKPFGEILRMLDTEAEAYFKKNPVYSYLTNNCGVFVQMLERVLQTQYGIVTVPCAPPMLRRDQFGATMIRNGTYAA